MLEFQCTAVLFDLDGVLVDSTKSVVVVWTAWSEKHGIPPAKTLEIIHGRRISPAESIEHLEAVTTADMQRVAGKYFTSESLALGALGNLNGFNVDRSRLKI